MKIYNSLNQLTNIKNTVITIGSFDGIHLGHKEILKQLNIISNFNNCDEMVITFLQHPRLFLDKINSIQLLNTIEEKYEILKNIGIKNCVALPFNNDFAEMTAHNFITEFLVKYFNPKFIVVGYDHQFGKNRLGNINLLRQYSQICNYEIIEILPQLIDEAKISSSLIRNYLQTGNIENANILLGYKYSLQGEVVDGKKLGKTIGFPTANVQNYNTEKLIPIKGVYAVDININNENIIYKAMCNIGFNPTIENNNKLKIEVHIFNFNKDIYKQKIRIYFKNKIRDEIKFNNIEELKVQLEKDKRIALNL